jgi:hypothetical protein
VKLESIVTLANQTTRLPFLAMERSLRAIGCDLPLRVIPYNDERFALPANSSWLEHDALFRWLETEVSHPRTRGGSRKLVCFLIANYQFVDSDIIFLRDPRDVLADCAGFVASCDTSWWQGMDAVTPSSIRILRERSSLWFRWTFNSGQFACDRALFALESLKATACAPDFPRDCLDSRFHEQMAMNLLVHRSGVPVSNLTHSPQWMESTWAGDYDGNADYRALWRRASNPPYLIHWAGRGAGGSAAVPQPINALFEEYLTAEERNEWRAQRSQQRAKKREVRARLAFLWYSRLRPSIAAFRKEWHAKGIYDVD